MDHSNAPWGDEEERSSGQRDLNFGGTMVGQCDDEGDEGYRRRVSRDPMSHRIIEKRRRDRMNSCLADLSRLIPAEYLRRGRGRIEKTEIIEMAIRHMRHLQESQQPFLSLGHPTPPLTTSSSSSSPGSCSSSPAITSMSSHQDVCEMADECNGGMGGQHMGALARKESSMSDQYRLGFFECLSEALHFLIEVEGFPAGGALCLSLDAHLRDHCAAMLQGGPLTSSKTECSVEDENHFQMEITQKKSTEHSNHDVPASEGEDLESVTPESDCRDCEVEQPRELRVMLTRNEQELHGGEGASILTLPGDSGASYKFKSNIKRRFTAGLEKRRKFEESEGRRCEEDTASTVSSLPSHAPHSTVHLCPQYSQMPCGAQQSDHTSPSRIPVFALHSEQSFYVPLMLDTETLAPHASLLSKSASALHPVTISVNFCTSGGVGECGGLERHNGIPLPTSRDFPCAVESSAIMDPQSKHNCRHWRPAENYISQ